MDPQQGPKKNTVKFLFFFENLTVFFLTVFFFPCGAEKFNYIFFNCIFSAFVAPYQIIL